MRHLDPDRHPLSALDPAPRLVATDLDGTLLRSDGTVSARTARVLAALEDRGVPVVFVTGRPTRWMEVVRRHVGGHGLAICSNGAVVLRLADDAVELVRPLTEEAGTAVVGALRAAMPEVRFAIESVEGFGKEPDYPATHPTPPGSPVEPIDRLLRRRPVKLMVRHPTLGPDAFLAVVDELAAGRAVATRSGTTAMVELSAAGVTKASTLELLCDRFGVAAHEVVSFGDMPNDLPMLAWAGRSFAVGDAHPALDAVVTDRARSNDEDGVAVALEALFGL
ncbi:HAD family hydrolase [Amnibacterium soli]|uniref:HAD family hydrolase n=1 Tax=Amnibacterium soli TaxID=1282736 RepID=A0ABP8YSI5_9MICO